MTNLFQPSSIALAIFQMFLIAGLGFFASYRGWITKQGVDTLSYLAINLFFPSFIFIKILETFRPEQVPYWWVLPISSLVMTLFAILICEVLKKVTKLSFPVKEMAVSVGFQNGAYLPMTLIAFLGMNDETSVLMVLTFLFMLGFNAMIWSFGVAYLGFGAGVRFKWQSIFNMPTVSIAAAMILVFLGFEKAIPSLFVAPLRMMGEACFAVSLIILGSSLEQSKGYRMHRWKDLSLSLSLKMILLPACVFLLLLVFEWDPQLELLLFLESMMPSAMSLVIIGAMTKADNQLLSGSIFYGHLLAILFIPMWFWVSTQIRLF